MPDQDHLPEETTTRMGYANMVLATAIEGGPELVENGLIGGGCDPDRPTDDGSDLSLHGSEEEVLATMWHR